MNIYEKPNADIILKGDALESFYPKLSTSTLLTSQHCTSYWENSSKQPEWDEQAPIFQKM